MVKVGNTLINEKMILWAWSTGNGGCEIEYLNGKGSVHKNFTPTELYDAIEKQKQKDKEDNEI